MNGADQLHVVLGATGGAGGALVGEPAKRGRDRISLRTKPNTPSAANQSFARLPGSTGPAPTLRLSARRSTTSASSTSRLLTAACSTIAEPWNVPG